MFQLLVTAPPTGNISCYFYLINVECDITIVRSNFMSFGSVEQILVPSEVENLFCADSILNKAKRINKQ